MSILSRFSLTSIGLSTIGSYALYLLSNYIISRRWGIATYTCPPWIDWYISSNGYRIKINQPYKIRWLTIQRIRGCKKVSKINQPKSQTEVKQVFTNIIKKKTHRYFSIFRQVLLIENAVKYKSSAHKHRVVFCEELHLLHLHLCPLCIISEQSDYLLLPA